MIEVIGLVTLGTLAWVLASSMRVKCWRNGVRPSVMNVDDTWPSQLMAAAIAARVFTARLTRSIP